MREQSLENHGVRNVDHLKFIETNQPTILGDHVGDRFCWIEWIRLVAADELKIFALFEFDFVDARMNIRHERIEVNSLLFVDLKMVDIFIDFGHRFQYIS